MNPTRRLLRWLVSLLVPVLMSGAVASAATLFVWPESPNPTEPYSDWATAAHVIQDAVDAAQAGDTVLVTNGVYTTGGRPAEGYALTNRVIVTNYLTLQSVNGPAVTIIVGAPPTQDSEGVTAVRCVYLGNEAMLNGFTLTNGHTQSKIIIDQDDDLDGAGAWCEPDGILLNCVITGNSAHFDPPGSGGGVSGGNVLNCTITDNVVTYEGGGAYRSALFDCILEGNASIDDSGGAVARCIADGCTMTGNWCAGDEGGGGAAYVSTLYNCTLVGNVSYRDGGGGACSSDLYNCTLVGNSATTGGGAGGGRLYNCTVTGNYSDNYGGVTGCEVYNSIVYHNFSKDGLAHYACTFQNSCVALAPEGEDSNLADDPQLASPTHLSAGSPCIGMGNPVFARRTDIDRDPWGNPPCIGADQFVPGSNTGPLTVSIVTDTTNAATGYALSFMAQIKGRTTASVWNFGDGTTLSNRPFAEHLWTVSGTNVVTLTAYNDEFAAGLSTTTHVCVQDQPVHYVNRANPTPEPPYKSWATAATVIQDAVAAAGPGSTVLVTNGVYEQGGVRLLGRITNRFALLKPIVVKSVNGPRVTMIVGAPPGVDDYGWGVGAVRCAYVGNGAILSGFTLTNGHTVTDFDGLVDMELSGAGVWCEDSGVVSNCVLVGNQASAYGKGYGGAARGGTLYNCVLAANAADEAGGGAAYSQLYNCTLCNNSAGYEAGGVFGCSVTNSIVYYNLAPLNPNYLNSTLDYCCTFPWAIGAEVAIDSEPQFVDLAAGDFRLRYGSPCIDTGLDLTELLQYDLDGNARPLAGDGGGLTLFDIGAYEYNPQTADSNGDGIPDWWVRHYGFSPNDPDLRHTDLDQDGQNTFQEWLADTNPTEPDSCFRIVAISNGPPVSVFFQSSSNRLYTLFVCTNLAGASTSWSRVNEQNYLPGTGHRMALHDPNTVGPRFYRIEATRP